MDDPPQGLVAEDLLSMPFEEQLRFLVRISDGWMYLLSLLLAVLPLVWALFDWMKSTILLTLNLLLPLLHISQLISLIKSLLLWAGSLLSRKATTTLRNLITGALLIVQRSKDFVVNVIRTTLYVMLCVTVTNSVMGVMLLINIVNEIRSLLTPVKFLVNWARSKIWCFIHYCIRLLLGMGISVCLTISPYCDEHRTVGFFIVRILYYMVSYMEMHY